MTAPRDRLVRDVIAEQFCAGTCDAIPDGICHTCHKRADATMRDLGMNPRAETMGDLEAGRALLGWMREGADVAAEPRYVRDGDEDTHDVLLTVYPEAAGAGPIWTRDSSATRAVLAVVDQIGASR